MYGILLSVMLFILAFAGVCLIFVVLFAFATAPDKRRKYTIVCMLDKSDEYAVLRLRWIYNAVNILGLRDYFLIAAVLERPDACETARIRSIFTDKEIVLICTKERLAEKISK